MRASARIGMVAGGYAIAVAVAWAVTAVYTFVTAGPDRLTYGAMYGFGDAVLFLGVFAVAALPATGLWLHFLRGSAWFWSALSVLGLGASALSLLLLGCELLRGPRAALLWAPLWFLSSPVFIGGFGLAFFFAPGDGTRRVLGWSAAIAGGSVGLLVVMVLATRP